MATGSKKNQCIVCERPIQAAYECKGCSQIFCLPHLTEHNQKLGEELDHIEDRRNQIQQILCEQTRDPQKHPLLQQIALWENDSIEKIKQAANEARQSLLIRINSSQHNLMVLTGEMKNLRKENDFNEFNLNELKAKVDQLRKQLHQPIEISIREDSTLIKSRKFSNSQKWKQYGTTVAGGHDEVSALNQLSSPLCIEIDQNQTIYIVDQGNDRLVAWDKDAANGRMVVGGDCQLSRPTTVVIDEKNDCFILSDYEHKRIVRYSRRNDQDGETIISNIKSWGLAMDKNGYLYVCDHEKHEVRRWKIGEKEGTLVAGGNRKGDGLHQLSEPRYIFVDEDESVYVTDRGNHRVMKWTRDAKKGVIVAGDYTEGNSLEQLSRPNVIFVDQSGALYIADVRNDRVVRWFEGSNEGEVVVGGNGNGNAANQFRNPLDMCFDHDNNLYVLDFDNRRVQKFLIDA